MRVNIFTICLLTAVLAFAFLVSSSTALAWTIPIVQGQVTDTRGSPLPGANVTIVDGAGNMIAQTISDSSGNFSFKNTSDRGTGRIQVTASYVDRGTTYTGVKLSPAWYPANKSIVVIDPYDTRVLTPFSTSQSALSQPFTALGQVTDSRGAGVAGANVTLYDGIYHVIGEATTDRDGNFAFTNVVASSPGCKATVTYNASGNTYRTNLNEVLWYPTEQGIVKFNDKDLELSNFPGLSSTGFVWGAIVDAAGNPLSGTVYLTNGTANLSIQTYESVNSSPGFISEVSAGNYTAYAEHADANGSLKSKPVGIVVQPAMKYLDSNAVTLVADQATPSAGATPATAPSAGSQPAPFVSQVGLMTALIVAVFVAVATDLRKRKNR